MTFKEYLRKAQIRDSVQGDFIKDVRYDHGMPDIEAWSDLKRYLKTKLIKWDDELQDNLMYGAYQVWRNYLNHLRK